MRSARRWEPDGRRRAHPLVRDAVPGRQVRGARSRRSRPSRCATARPSTASTARATTRTSSCRWRPSRTRRGFERYWYGEEFSLWRADYSSWYQVPVLYTWHTLSSVGGLAKEPVVVGPAAATGWFERLYAAAGSRRRGGARGIAAGRTRCLAAVGRERAARGRRPPRARRRQRRSATTPSCSPRAASRRPRSTSRRARSPARARRFPDSRVDYRVADLFEPAGRFGGGRSTSSSSASPCRRCRPTYHAEVAATIAGFVAPGGTLIVVSAAREGGR